MEINNREIFITGNKIYLRAYKPGDEEIIARIENHPDPRNTLFYATPTTVEFQAEKSIKQTDNPNTILLTICKNEDMEPIGQTALFRIDWIGGMGTFYIGIADKENWSKGYGAEATQLVCEYAFLTLNLHRIHLVVAVENENAVKLYQKIGFQIEGTMREAMYHHGRYCDFYVMGLLRSDWEEKLK